MTPDHINAAFEFVGGLMLWGNVARLYRDKLVRGVYWPYMSFFAFWGLWNLYYYPALEQWWSFAAGASLVVANMVWLTQLFYYNWREHNRLVWKPMYYTLDGEPGPKGWVHIDWNGVQWPAAK